jgi:hypothetical protein
MSTTLTNNYINKFDEKLKIYNNIFFKVFKSYNLLDEVNNIKHQSNSLNIPSDSSSTYSTVQFNNFIRNIINYKIINNDYLKDTNNNMDFINRVVSNTGDVSYNYNTNVKTNIIETLKVINVFVDILEAYKYCIDNEGDTTSPSGYTKDTEIDRIELVSDTTRFYTSAGVSMYPNATIKNAGYIRPVKIDSNQDTPTLRVLYLSIQSFYTGFETSTTGDDANNYTYKMFNKDCVSGGTITNSINDNILSSASKLNATSTVELASQVYARQKYDKTMQDLTNENVSLNDRNKALINLLLKTLFNIPLNFRKQSVFALYYYYKFVQLYSTLIINVSNVMYASVENTAPKCIDVYNTGRERYITGIAVSTAGSSYANSTSYTITSKNSDLTTVATATILSDGSGNIVKDKVANITNRAPITVLSSTLTNTITPAKPSATGNTAVFKLTDVPLAIENTSMDHLKNIERLKTVIEDISNCLTTITGELSKYSVNLDSNPLIITTDSGRTPAEVSVSTENKVVITVSEDATYKKLKYYNDNYDVVNNYIIYDKINIRYYEILEINDIEDVSPKSINITINAVIKKDSSSDKNIYVFLNANSAEVNSGDTIPASTPFLEIRKKDINAYKNEYIDNKNTVYSLNESIAYNTNKVQHQKNLYDSQFNKNSFLTRQILAYNIIVSIIVLILIFINIVNIDKQLKKSISLACLGGILLLFVVYIISNITYIETFALMTTDKLYQLTKSNYDSVKLNTHTYNILKATTLNTEIDALNQKFINYFEKILISIPASDNIDFYREIKEDISTEIDNKNYIKNLLEFNKSQGSNNMGSLKYEIENNKLYIMTLLISSIIFIGLYNIYINYIVTDKYLSLMIFICAILFIIIISYYIINSNKRVRTVYKNKYWGPESSKYWGP